jgi:outer membrane lipoprotein-sorting protein
MMRAVSDLGELLVLLHGARGRISTVRATVRAWQHTQRVREAMERVTRDGSVVSYAPDGGHEGEVESIVRLWLAPPDRVREEREGADGEWFGVRRGRSWWHYGPQGGAISNEGDPEVGSGMGEEQWWLLDPAAVIGLLDFDEIAPVERAGRATLRVRAVPRAPTSGDDWPLFRLGAAGADALLLDVDAERGVLLRIEARFEGEPFSIAEVTEIAYDETFADDVFEFTPPPGEQVRSITDQFALQHDLTIEQAVARASFTVWIPARLPAGWETDITFAAGNDRPPMAPHVHLHYRAPDGTHTVSIAESPADHPGEHSEYEHERPNPWREIEHDGRRIQVREPAESWQPAQPLLELDGTRIHIHSRDLTADWLADLAAGLAPAPSEPPTLGS